LLIGLKVVEVKVVGLTRFYNEGENGNLERCLKQLSELCDEIVCCNDSSTDNSREIAERYTSYIIDLPNEFVREQEHKQRLLEFALREIPDIGWFCYIDPDELFERRIYEALPKLLRFGERFGVDGFSFHLINLWRSECWYRLDNRFNDLWKVHVWRNNGRLRFDTSPGLHRPLHPLGLERILPTNIQVLHFGFSTEQLIARKYKTYRALGQRGWALERLIDESTLQLSPVNLSWFPEWCKPKIVPKPQPLPKEKWEELCE